MDAVRPRSSIPRQWFRRVRARSLKREKIRADATKAAGGARWAARDRYLRARSGDKPFKVGDRHANV